jgi:ligand-binding SRPBCC domain-containing protein
LFFEKFSAMQIRITTEIRNTVKNIYKGFDKHLFMELAPPFPITTLKRFDGCKKGDVVHIDLSFIVYKERWISIITENVQNDDEVYFIDEGRMLPFFLKYWRHKHIIQKKDDSNSLIIDEIEFKGANKLTEILLYPGIYLQFLYRKPIYRKKFNL